MKKLIYIAMLLIISAECFAQTNVPASKNNSSAEQQLPPDSVLKPSNFISVKAAEKILGQPAHVKDSLHKIVNGYLRFLFTYTGNTKDTNIHQFHTLFFSMEQFPQTEVAVSTYSSIKSENEKTLKVENIAGMGDEAMTVKDEAGFPFIMVRKKCRLFKFKLRNQPDNAALNKLIIEAKKIVERN